MTYIWPNTLPGGIPGQHDWAKPWPGVGTGTGIITISGGNNILYPYQIRKTENGFLLLSNGKEYVFENIANLLAHLSTELETK